jgi:hypothetical protein
MHLFYIAKMLSRRARLWGRELWQAVYRPTVSAVTHEVGYASQFASADDALLFASRQKPLRQDANWPLSGADSLDEYCLWAAHCCGMACLLMIIGMRQADLTVIGLAKACERFGGYHKAGHTIAEPGLHYHAFVRFLRETFGLEARVFPIMTRKDILQCLEAGQVVMVSVHPSIYAPHQKSPGRGGHLVLITGFDQDRQSFTYNDPAGPPDRRQGVTITYADFERFFGHKGIALPLPK